MLLVLTGKTASGKDTVLGQILTKYPDMVRVVTTTSRIPRSGERMGVDYNFVSEDKFKQKIEAGDFVEYVEYGGNLYGTEKRELMPALQKDVIWRIDPSRAGEIRQFIRSSFATDLAENLLKKVVVVYLTVDDVEVVKRLQNRGLSIEQIQRRMDQDKIFWQKFGQKYDFVVENTPGDLENTVGKVSRIIDDSRPS